MLKSSTRWHIKDVCEEKVKQLQNELPVSHITARLLIGRGIETIDEASQFLNIQSVSYHEPFLLKDMDRATKRIKQAVSEGERILIFGDYDADGVTSTSLLVYALRELEADLLTYIPNRFTEGYGPNESAFRWAKQQGVDVIITVDTGIAASHEAVVAKELDIDFIITDHHEPPEQLPNAYAIINPKQADCDYPFKELAGAGVALKLAQALLGKLPIHLLDLAAIGTIADLVPLKGENRKIAFEGLPLIEKSSKPGIRALLQMCRLNGKPVNEEHVGFLFGPRINAAGRMESADPALQLLISTDDEEANDWAKYIDELNKERQQLVEKMTKQAVEIVEQNYKNDRVIVIAQEDWNSGVVGIVASRLVGRYHRPAVVLAIDPETKEATGSARSIENFNLYANLAECRHILINFGGHTMAAGLTIAVHQTEELRIKLNELAEKQLQETDFIPITTIDTECHIEDVTLDMLEEIAQLAPFGIGNPAPTFLLSSKQVKQIRKIGSKENHLKFQLKTEDKLLDGVGFHFGHLFHDVSQGATVSMVGELSINEWNGYRKPQLMLSDLSVDDWQLFDFRGTKRVSEVLDSLPAEKVQLIYFRSQTLELLGLNKWGDLAYNPILDIGPFDKARCYHILLDLPQSNKALVDWYQSLLHPPERTYTVFHHEENHLFTPIPTREHFKLYYAILKKEKQLALSVLDQLARTYELTVDSFQFMTKVFTELDFVTINDGVILFVENPVNKALTESNTYQKKLQEIEVEKTLLYSSYDELKSFFQKTYDGIYVEEAMT